MPKHNFGSDNPQQIWLSKRAPKKLSMVQNMAGLGQQMRYPLREKLLDLKMFEHYELNSFLVKS